MGVRCHLRSLDTVPGHLVRPGLGVCIGLIITCIGHQEILGSMIAEHRVAFEDRDGLAPGVGYCDVDDMAVGISDRNGERASGRGSTGEESNGKCFGNHVG